MVDISGKTIAKRSAVAQAVIRMRPQTTALLKKGLLKKGDALTCARLAGIMAAKRTPDIIPLCHHIALEHVSVDFDVREESILVWASVRCTAKTGAEMEALTAASIAALTLYDMCKAADKQMVIDDIRLVTKLKEPIE